MLFAAMFVAAFVAIVLARPAHAAPGTRTLYLIRHGIYDRDTTADDRVGNGLNAQGREQAAAAGHYLARLPVKYAKLVSSTLTRARETADVIGIALKLTPERDSLLSECTPVAAYAPWNAGEKPTEIDQCEQQLAAAWAKYAVPSPDGDEADVLVAHGNVIRWLAAKTLGDSKHWSSMDIANGSLTILTIRPDGMARLAMFSELGDLPLDKLTWSGKGPNWKAPAAKAMK